MMIINVAGLITQQLFGLVFGSITDRCLQNDKSDDAMLTIDLKVAFEPICFLERPETTTRSEGYHCMDVYSVFCI